MTGTLPLLLLMAAGAVAQSAQKSLMISERALARIASRPSVLTPPAARRPVHIAPLRAPRLCGPAMIPGIAVDQDGHARINWSPRRAATPLEWELTDRPGTGLTARPGHHRSGRVPPCLSTIRVTPMLRLRLTPARPGFATLGVPEMGAPGEPALPSW